MCGVQVSEETKKFAHYYYEDNPLVANSSVIPVSFRSFPKLDPGLYNINNVGFELCYRLEDADCTTLCYRKPCLHGGRCTENGEKYSCSCEKGFTGTNCETDIDECVSAPCQNNGSCVDQAGKYICHCDLGYAGIRCEIPMDVRGFSEVVKDGPFEVGGTLVLVYALKQAGVEYQWEFTRTGSDVSVKLGRHQVLTKTNLNFEDSGVYRCTVSKDDQTTEAVFTVNVVESSSTSEQKSCAPLMTAPHSLVVFIVVWCGGGGFAGIVSLFIQRVVLATITLTNRCTVTE